MASFNTAEETIDEIAIEDISFDLYETTTTQDAETNWKPRADTKRNNNSAKGVVTKAKKRWQWKKPKDMPKRPLSAYNLFFAYMRMKLKKDAILRREIEGEPNCKNSMGFAGLAKTVAAAWKALETPEKDHFKMKAQIEKVRYEKEIALWKAKLHFKNKMESAPEKLDWKRSETGAQLAIEHSHMSFEEDFARVCNTHANNIGVFDNLLTQLDEEDCTFLIATFGSSLANS